MIDPTYIFQRQWEEMDPICAEINRLADENRELRALMLELISGARRDRSIISQKAGAEHVIETCVTKGQVLRALNLTRAGGFQ